MLFPIPNPGDPGLISICRGDASCHGPQMLSLAFGRGCWEVNFTSFSKLAKQSSVLIAAKASNLKWRNAACDDLVGEVVRTKHVQVKLVFRLRGLVRGFGSIDPVPLPALTLQAEEGLAHKQIVIK